MYSNEKIKKSTDGPQESSTGDLYTSEDGIKWQKIFFKPEQNIGGITKMVTACEAASKTCVFGTNKGQIYAWDANAKTADDFKNVYNETSESPVTALYVTYRSVGSSLLQESIAVGGFQNGKLGYTSVNTEKPNFTILSLAGISSISQLLTYSYQKTNYLVAGFDNAEMRSYNLNSNTSAVVTVPSSQSFSQMSLSHWNAKIGQEILTYDALFVEEHTLDNNVILYFTKTPRLHKCLELGTAECYWNIVEHEKLSSYSNSKLRFEISSSPLSGTSQRGYIFITVNDNLMDGSTIKRGYFSEDFNLGLTSIANSSSWLPKDDPMRPSNQPPITHLTTSPTDLTGFGHLVAGLKGGEVAMEKSMKISVPINIPLESRIATNSDNIPFWGIDERLGGLCWAACIGAIIEFYKPGTNKTVPEKSPLRGALAGCEITNQFKHMNNSASSIPLPEGWDEKTPSSVGVDCCLPVFRNEPYSGTLSNYPKNVTEGCPEEHVKKYGGCGTICSGGLPDDEIRVLEHYNIGSLFSDMPASFFRAHSEIESNKPIFLRIFKQDPLEGHAITLFGYNANSISNSSSITKVTVWNSSPVSSNFKNTTWDYKELFDGSYNNYIWSHTLFTDAEPISVNHDVFFENNNVEYEF